MSDDAGEAKGSRSKVVGLKLRYKTATVDEFIEKYALDVSPRGIYVNIAKPLAAGTLVKLEIRLASEQVVIKGAGSVVLNRDRAQASGAHPAGLWIKFIQIDEPSKAFIEKLTSVRADAGLTYEEHEEEAEDATVVGIPAQSHQEAPVPPVPTLPVPATPKLRATLVGIAAPSALPARPRLPSLPPPSGPSPAKAPSLPAPPVPAGPKLRATLMGITARATLPPRTGVSSLPPPPLAPRAKARSLPPPPDRTSQEQGETDAEDATVVWGELPAASTRTPAQPRLPSLPPPRAPLAKGLPAPPLPVRTYDEQSEKDAEDDTFIWDHEPTHQEVPVSPVPIASPVPTPAAPMVATAQERSARAASLRATVIRKRSPLPRGSRPWGRWGAWVASGLFAAVLVALAFAISSTSWFRALTTAASGPGVAEGGPTSAATAMSSDETAPAQARRTVEAPADAAPAATTSADAAGEPPTMGTSAQAIAGPTAKPAPGTRATSPVATVVPIVRAKPKPKPAPTIDDGF